MKKAQVYFTNIIKSLVIVVLIAVFTGLIFASKVQAVAGINRQINFQGKLVNNPAKTNVSDTSYTVVFTIYDKASGGTALWTETQSVTTADGIFRVALGSVTPFPTDFNFNWDGLYLGMKVNSDSEMTPRITLAAVPYAFNAQKVSGLTVQDDSGNASTSATLRVANGKTITLSNSLTFSGTDGKTFVFPNLSGSSDNIVTEGFSQTLTNKTIGSTGLTFSGAATDITTTSGEDLTLTPAGNGKLVLTSDFDTPVLVGSTANTSAVLSVRGGIGNNAAFIVDNLNNGDLFTASASGTTKFRVANNGDLILSAAINLGGTNGTSGNCLLGGATAAWGSCSAGAGSNWDILNGVITPKLSSTLDLLLGSQATASAKFAFTGLSDLNNQTQASISGQLIVMPNNGYGGNVGIGTTSPKVGLQVGNVAGTYSTLAVAGSEAGTIGVGGVATGRVYVQGSGQADFTFDHTGAALNTKMFQFINKDGVLRFRSLNDDGSIKVDPILGMTSTGNVGIGTTIPTAVLDVAGAASVGGQLTFRSGTAQIQSTVNQTLTIGGDTTGNIILAPLNGTGTITFEKGAQDVILAVTAPATATRTYTIPDFGANDSFVGLAATQALTGKTYNGLTVNTTTGTLAVTNGKTLTLSDSTTLGTNAITLAGGEVITFSATNALSLLTTGTTSVTLPTSGTLVSSVTTTNGVSASNTAGALSFTLGAITPTSVNGLTLTALATGFTIAGGTTSKTLTLSNTLTFAGTDGSTLNIGAGGTLGSNAFTSTAYAPLASPTFTGTVTIPTPFTIGAVSMTSTGTQLNYLNGAAGTTGTATTNLVFSTSPTLTTPILGAATGTSLALGTNPAAAGTLRLPNATYVTARNAANSADINMIQIDSSNLVSFGANTAAFTLGGAVTGNSQSITGINSLSSTSLTITGSLTANGSTGSGLCLNGGATAAWGSCGAGGGGSSNWTLDTANGLLRPNNNVVDIVFGGTSTASAKFTFGNLNAGTPTATFSGDLVMNERPNTSAANMQKWTKITGTAGTIGGGTAGVASVSASVVYNGSLYVGTQNTNQAEIYRYNGDDLGTWTKVSQTTAGTIANAGTASIDAVSSLTVYNGYLYAGTTELNSAEIYRYDGGSTWTKVSLAAGTILTTTAIDGIPSMAVFGGRLFAGTREGAKAEIYMYNGGTTWVAVTGTAGTLVATNTVSVDAITQMVVWNNTLIVGTLRTAGDADVLRWNGIVGGSNFFALNLASTTGSYLIDSAAVTAYQEVSAMTVWAGKLIIGLRKTASIADILMYQQVPNGAAPINSWTRLNSAAGTIGTANIDSVTAMTVYNGRLYVGTTEPNGAEIYRYDTGKSWTRVSQNTVGMIASAGTGSIDGISTLISYNHNSLFAGTLEGTTAEGYVYQVSIDQSYAIKFHAGASQGGDEQNNNLNLGSIFFVASLSANVNNKAGNTGSFVFSHSITTNNGSYDVAEDYPTRDDTLEPGDVVSIDPNERGFVKKSEGNYDYTAIGVYSENPALRLSQDTAIMNGGRAIPIALAGRAPVKVSTENGEIKNGDPLTPSSTPGVAMKAKKSGLIIGQAMESFACHPELVSGSNSCQGKVMAYIKSSSYNGSIAQSFAGIDVNSQSFGSDVLTALKSQDTGLSGSDIVTDRLIAGIEIITPKLTVDTLFAKRIKADQIDLPASFFEQALQAGGLEFITDQISNIKFQISNLDEKIATSSGKVASASSSAALDSQAESLLSKLLARDLEDSSASATMSQNGVVVTTLNVAGLSIFDDNIRVKGNGLFEGLLSVIDTITTNNLIVNSLSTFFGDAVFKAKVAFEGPVTFNSDTGGNALVKKDDRRVEVKFDKEFEDAPIVNASVSFDEEKDKDGSPKETSELEQAYFEQGYSYIIVNKSTKGFSIALNKKATYDINFTWTALRVKDAKTIQSRAPN